MHLGDRDRSLQLGHPVVVAGDHVLVTGAHALVAQDPEPLGPALVVRRNDPALARRDVLRRVEGEARHPVGTHGAGPDPRAVRLGGVLDDREAVALGDP